MGAFSIWHLLIIGFVVILIFGNRLPSVMRNLGRGVVEFKKGIAGIEDELNDSGKRIEEKRRDETVAKKAEEPPAGGTTENKV